MTLPHSPLAKGIPVTARSPAIQVQFSRFRGTVQ